jgi:hypothetical protein
VNKGAAERDIGPPSVVHRSLKANSERRRRFPSLRMVQ